MSKFKNLFKKSIGALLVLFLAVGYGWSNVEARPGNAPEMVEVLIGFEGSPGVSEYRLIQQKGGTVSMELGRINVLLVKLPARAVTALENAPGIAFVEENGIMEAHGQVVPWGIDRVFGGEEYSFETWGHTTGTGVGVAILDTGIDCGHQDLTVVGGTNTVDRTNYCSDGSGHGTHVAGTVAGLDNDLGVVGVSPSADLYAVKVLSDSGSGSDATVAAGILWVVEQNQENEKDIKIINMSLGGRLSSVTMQSAVQVANEAGILLVASAGNSGPRANSVGFPAAYPEVIAVSATDSNDESPNFSSRGSQVELAAPGVSVRSTTPGNTYGSKSGTSMASPHVAGVAALVWGADPSLSNVEVRAVLQSTAENIGLSKDRQGHGLVRADLAVREVLGDQTDPNPDPIVTYEVELTPTEQTKTGVAGTEVSYEFTINNTGTKDDTYSVEVSGNVWAATTSRSSVTVSAGGSVKIEVVHQVPDEAVAGVSDTGVLSISSENASTSASFKTTVTSEDGNGDTSEPTIDSFELVNTSNRAWARMEVNWAVSGTNLSTVEINISGTNSDSVTYSVSGDEASGSYTFSVRGGHGDYSVELTVTDARRNVTTETKEITL